MTTATESTQPDADEELVERYIAKWEQETHPDLAGVYRDCSIDDVIRPYIAITREVGTGAAELAATVGETLGWPVINRRLVNLIALNDSYRERLTGSLESWAADAVAKRVAEIACGDDYGRWVAQVLLGISTRTELVILGRGATFIFPRKAGLSVRLTAPVAYRAARVASSGDLDLGEARAQVRRIDEERKSFVRAQFGVDIDDISLYDLVIDREEFTIERIAEQVLHAVKAKIGAER